MNCSELFQAYINYKAAFVCGRTLEKYSPVTDTLWNCYGERLAASITKADIGFLIARLKQSGLAPETIKRKIILLAGCWEWAIECELLLKNPWKGVSKMLKVPAPKPPKPFTTDEIRAIIQGFERHPKYNHLAPFVRFLMGTGVRTSEAIGLRWGDLLPDCTQCTIGTQLTRGIRKPTKTGKTRSFRLPASITAMLIEMRPSNPNPETLIFWWKGQYRIDAQNFRKGPWMEILKGQSIPYRKPYNCRHSFLSHCLEGGMNPVTVAQIAGHSTRVLLQHYAGCVKPVELPEIIRL